jgi:uncharacterized protein
MTAGERLAPLLAGRAPISGYGRGLFRTGGIEYHGSLLILPEGTYPWDVASADALTLESLAPVLELGPAAGFLLLGTGAAQIFPDPAIRTAFAAAGLGLEAMDTGAACRTYNVLLGEERVFCAALIAISG